MFASLKISDCNFHFSFLDAYEPVYRQVPSLTEQQVNQNHWQHLPRPANQVLFTKKSSQFFNMFTNSYHQFSMVANSVDLPTQLMVHQPHIPYAQAVAAHYSTGGVPHMRSPPSENYCMIAPKIMASGMEREEANSATSLYQNYNSFTDQVIANSTVRIESENFNFGSNCRAKNVRPSTPIRPSFSISSSENSEHFLQFSKKIVQQPHTPLRTLNNSPTSNSQSTGEQPVLYQPWSLDEPVKPSYGSLKKGRNHPSESSSSKTTPPPISKRTDPIPPSHPASTKSVLRVRAVAQINDMGSDIQRDIQSPSTQSLKEGLGIPPPATSRMDFSYPYQPEVEPITPPSETIMGTNLETPIDLSSLASNIYVQERSETLASENPLKNSVQTERVIERTVQERSEPLASENPLKKSVITRPATERTVQERSEPLASENGLKNSARATVIERTGPETLEKVRDTPSPPSSRQSVEERLEIPAPATCSNDCSYLYEPGVEEMSPPPVIHPKKQKLLNHIFKKCKTNLSAKSKRNNSTSPNSPAYATNDLKGPAEISHTTISRDGDRRSNSLSVTDTSERNADPNSSEEKLPSISKEINFEKRTVTSESRNSASSPFDNSLNATPQPVINVPIRCELNNNEKNNQSPSTVPESLNNERRSCE